MRYAIHNAKGECLRVSGGTSTWEASLFDASLWSSIESAVAAMPSGCRIVRVEMTATVVPHQDVDNILVGKLLAKMSTVERDAIMRVLGKGGVA